MIFDNEISIKFKSNSQNEAFARTAVSAFVTAMSPTMNLGELSDIKTAVSEAVTNCIIHGYPKTKGDIYIKCSSLDKLFYIEIHDDGVGISNIKEAMQPMHTTSPQTERSGLGFTVMEAFMDSINVKSEPNKGTTVTMCKKIS